MTPPLWEIAALLFWACWIGFWLWIARTIARLLTPTNGEGQPMSQHTDEG